MNDVEIRSITDASGLREVEHLQRAVWGMPDREVVPVHQLLAAASAGGAVLGAFVPPQRLVGFCYGFVGVRDGRPLFYSHMAGVLETHRGTDVGFRLKRRQREVALERGLARMIWTFDPLASLNARFNLHRLGASAARYYVNYYGEMADELNRGLPSDRLEVDWWLTDPRVEALMARPGPERDWSGAAQALAAVPRGDALAPGEPALDLDGAAVLVELPAAFAQIKQNNLPLAGEWLAAVRRALDHYLNRGYAAVDFVIRPAGDRGAYVLSRGDAP